MGEAVYLEKKPFEKFAFWYENLGNVAQSKENSFIIYNGKKYVIEHVKKYDDISSYYDPAYFGKSKDYYLVIMKRNLQLLIKKIICIVTFGIIPKRIRDFKKSVTFLGNETAIKEIMSKAVKSFLDPDVNENNITNILKNYELKVKNRKLEEKDILKMKKLKNLLEIRKTARNKYCEMMEQRRKKSTKDNDRQVVENVRLDSLRKRDAFSFAMEEFVGEKCKKIKKMDPLKLVEFLEGENGKKFFEIKGFLNVNASFFSKNIPSIINRFTNITNLTLHHQIIPKIQENAFNNLKKLDSLTISHSHVREINKKAFNGLENLKTLDIDGPIRLGKISKTLKNELRALKNLKKCFIGNYRNKPIFLIEKEKS